VVRILFRTAEMGNRNWVWKTVDCPTCGREAGWKCRRLDGNTDVENCHARRIAKANGRLRSYIGE
jgi:hypothetical protein